MTLNKFIFSTQRKDRITRHLIFWIVFSLHFVFQNLMIGGPGEAKTSRTFLESFAHYLYFLPIYFFVTYFFIQVLLPKFLYPQKWAGFILTSLLLFIFCYTAVYYAGVFYWHNVMKIPSGQVTFGMNRYHAIVDGMFVPFMLLGIAAGIKFSKKWYIQQRENEKLAKQKLLTELQLLKTSIHPRFLFHSLQTVQKHINNASEESSSLILQLSDLLSYILYEKDKNWVLLEKELEIIRYYIQLEEKGFNENITIKTEFPKNAQRKFIVPFLLLSLVESSFEYFVDTGQDEPLLTLIARVNENVLHCQLYFSRPEDEAEDAVFPGEKINSIQKQLKAQYPGLHQLHVNLDKESISLDLKLPLYSGDLIHEKINSTINEPTLV